MIQASQPHAHAEDPFGLQRPTDRDEESAAEAHAESLSDLEPARLVSTPGQAKEVFISDDPPDASAQPGRPHPPPRLGWAERAPGDAGQLAQALRDAGIPALYQSQRRSRRDSATLLLIDVSGSTGGWISAHRRVIDVEREALLLVCLALNGLGEPTAVQAFSCQRPRALTEASLQGISPFCLTVGRHASTHMAAILGAQHDALLNRPELLPLMLLGWMKRLVRAWAGRPPGQPSPPVRSDLPRNLGRSPGEQRADALVRPLPGWPGQALCHGGRPG